MNFFQCIRFEIFFYSRTWKVLKIKSLTSSPPTYYVDICVSLSIVIYEWNMNKICLELLNTLQGNYFYTFRYSFGLRRTNIFYLWNWSKHLLQPKNLAGQINIYIYYKASVFSTNGILSVYRKCMRIKIIIIMQHLSSLQKTSNYFNQKQSLSKMQILSCH